MLLFLFRIQNNGRINFGLVRERQKTIRSQVEADKLDRILSFFFFWKAERFLNLSKLKFVFFKHVIFEQGKGELNSKPAFTKQRLKLNFLKEVKKSLRKSIKASYMKVAS